MPKQTTPKSFFTQARKNAHIYGFEEVHGVLQQEGEEQNNVKLLKNKEDLIQKHPLETKVLRWFLENNFDKTKNSFLMYVSNIDKKHRTHVAHGTQSGDASFTLLSVGVHSAFSEILLINTAISILKSLGIAEYSLCLNSIGDYDSAFKHHRDLKAYLRTHIKSMDPKSAQLARTDVHKAYRHIHSAENLKDIKERMPAPVRYLSENSRKHYECVVVSLGNIGIEYELVDELYEANDSHCHTIFTITSDHHPIEVKGSRLDNLSASLFNIPAPMTTLTLTLQKEKVIAPISFPAKRTPKARAGLVHFCQEAQIQSLALIEELRQLNVPIVHTIHYDRPLLQLSNEKIKNLPYVILIGKEELNKKEAIVRHRKSERDKKVPFHKLANHIKRL